MTDKWCTLCKNNKFCAYIHPYIGFYCPGMESVIDNKSSRKEPLVADLYDGEPLTEDYKDVLNRLSSGKHFTKTHNYHNILQMPIVTLDDIRIKAISAMLFFELPATKIIKLLRLTKSNFYRIVKK